MKLPLVIREAAPSFLVTFLGVLSVYVAMAAMFGQWSCQATECDAMGIIYLLIGVPACIAIGVIAAMLSASVGSSAVGMSAGAFAAQAVDLLFADWQNQVLPGVLMVLPGLGLILLTFYLVRERREARAARTQPWPEDQAPPNHKCGRCGKPLSPAWRKKCKHCGASYLEFPPEPREVIGSRPSASGGASPVG